MLGAGLTFFTTSARLKCLLSKDTSERRLFVPKGYMLSAHRKLADPEKAEAYRALARPALEAMGGKIIAASDNIVAKENGLAERTVLIEFRSMAAAVAAYEAIG